MSNTNPAKKKESEMPDESTTQAAATVVQKVQDPATALFRLLAFALMLTFLTVLSYLSASNFDMDEIKLIGGMAVVTLLVLFYPELARGLVGRFLGGKSQE